MPAPPPRILPCSLSQFAHRGRISALSVTLTITPPHTACTPGQSSARRRQRWLRMLLYVIPPGRRCRVAPAAKPNGKTAPNQTGKKRGGAARDPMSARGRGVIETRPTALGRHVLVAAVRTHQTHYHGNVATMHFERQCALRCIHF